MLEPIWYRYGEINMSKIKYYFLKIKTFLEGVFLTCIFASFCEGFATSRQIAWKGHLHVTNISYEYFEMYNNCKYKFGPALYRTECDAIRYTFEGLGVYNS
jgi:hypothetical protein